MNSRPLLERSFRQLAIFGVAWTLTGYGSDLEPRGEIHIPIGIPNSLDTLKTFVEAEGDFSPGFGTFGVAFWVYDPAARQLIAPTQPKVVREHGLAANGLLIPWTKWLAGEVEVRSEVCQVQRGSPDGDVQVVASRVNLTNVGNVEKKITLFACVHARGAAGNSIYRLGALDDTISVQGHPALLSNQPADALLTPAPVETRQLDESRTIPPSSEIRSDLGDASGAFRFDVTLGPGESKSFGFISPVLHGRRAARHQWDGVSAWAQHDETDPILGSQGVEQPAPATDYYRAIRADDVFAEAEADWRGVQGKVEIQMPDRRWGQAFAAITGHLALTMNEGAPDLAVVNANTFTRAGVLMTNALQKSGNIDLASQAIAFFLQHPFSGRIEPEADNPGEVLWILGEQWLFTWDRDWLERIYPSAKKLAALIEYCATGPEPHWVSATSLEFGDALPPDQRMKLRPGACDGDHPRYTEAWSIAGLSAAAMLGEAMNSDSDRDQWRALRDKLVRRYDEKFGADLAQDYGSNAVLWPCRIYPLGSGRGYEQFRSVAAQESSGPRYFPLALAHQGLLAGNRAAGAKTLALHLDHEQMHGWYAFDEGVPSPPGNWMKVVSNWSVRNQGEGGAPSAVAMPHGWVMAEFQLLLRDALAFEDGDKLVLFGGVPEAWLNRSMTIKNLPTHFGALSVEYRSDEKGVTLRFTGSANPPGGFAIRRLTGDVAAPGSSKTLVLPDP
jgi:hypothetical protein